MSFPWIIVQRPSAWRQMMCLALTGAISWLVMGFFSECRADSIFVANRKDHNIVKFTADGVGSIFYSSAALKDPGYMAFDKRGDLYVASMADKTIWRITPDGKGTIFASGPFEGPAGMAFDRFGSLFVVDRSRQIFKVSPTGAVSPFAKITADKFGERGIAFDQAGNLYIGTAGAHSVERFTPAGEESIFAKDQPFLFGTTGIAFDRAGHLYVACWGSGHILKYSNGVPSVFADHKTFELQGNKRVNPSDIAIDSEDNVFVAVGVANLVVKVTPSGASTVFASTLVNSPDWIAVRHEAPGIPPPAPLASAPRIPTPAPQPVIAMAAATPTPAPPPPAAAPATSNAETCHVYTLCDFSGEIYVNGNLVLKPNNWSAVYQADLPLKHGDIISAIVTDVHGGPGGRFAFLAMKDNKPFITTKNFHCATAVKPDWLTEPSLNGFHRPLFSPLRGAVLGNMSGAEQAWSEKWENHFAIMFFKCIVP